MKKIGHGNITAYGYIRVSSRGQLKGGGLTRQKQSIETYATKHKIKMECYFKERGVSGTANEDDRPAFQEMLAAILKNGTKTVIIERLDRLAREYRIQETLIVYLASKGINLIQSSTEENVTESVMSDPMKKALVQIQGVFAELEKNLLVKKLRTARINKKATDGKCEGRKGYKDSSADNLIIVKEIKRLRRKPKGGGRKRKTYQQIADILNTGGRVSMDGKAFTAKNVAAIVYRH